jgi:mannitol 2-dehydrogenase
MSLVVASWARYAEGQDEHSQPIEVFRLRERLIETAPRQDREPLIFSEVMSQLSWRFRP